MQNAGYVRYVNVHFRSPIRNLESLRSGRCVGGALEVSLKQDVGYVGYVHVHFGSPI